MAKVNENQNAVLDKLHTMIMKKAEEARASGVPGKDTNYQSVSKETEKVDKEQAGSPEKHTQGYKQEQSTDDSKPVASEKPALTNCAPPQNPPEKSAAELGREILAMINNKKAEDDAAAIKEAEAKKNETTLKEAQAKLDNKEAQDKPSGVPGKDTNYQSVSKDTEKVDKEQAGSPEKHTQGYKQKPSTDSSKPVANTKKSEEEIAKEAAATQAREIGRQMAVELLKRASRQTEDLQKQAGRRDFEALITEASAKLEEEKQAEKLGADLFDEMYTREKQAEANGQAAFVELYKQASYEFEINKLAALNRALESKVAALTSELNATKNEAATTKTAAAKFEAELQKKSEEDREAQKMAQLVSIIKSEVLGGLKQEILQK